MVQAGGPELHLPSSRVHDCTHLQSSAGEAGTGGSLRFAGQLSLFVSLGQWETLSKGGGKGGWLVSKEQYLSLSYDLHINMHTPTCAATHMQFLHTNRKECQVCYVWVTHHSPSWSQCFTDTLATDCSRISQCRHPKGACRQDPYLDGRAKYYGDVLDIHFRL